MKNQEQELKEELILMERTEIKGWDDNTKMKWMALQGDLMLLIEEIQAGK